MAVTLVLPILHLVWCVALQVGVLAPSEGSWTWFPVFLVDFPFSILPLMATAALPEGLAARIPPLVVLGIPGTVWWYFLSTILVSVLSPAGSRLRTER